MTTLTLTKHHGLGNDFLVVFHPEVADLPELARRLCDRRRGVGADGLLVGESEPGHAARMVLYNADGSRAEMSGNGIRCFAQALASRRGDLATQRILTDAGERTVRLVATDRADTIEASVEMGTVEHLGEPAGWEALGCHPDRPVLHLGLGNPHSVVGVDDVSVVDLVALGAKVPQVNLEIVEPGPETNAVTMRVHERGAGITEACGTGACASAYAAVSWGLVPASVPEIVVHMDGGSAKVALDTPEAGHVTLTGPATHVATITVAIDLDGRHEPAGSARAPHQEGNGHP
jgi:diaminopimelate epimerase